MLDRFVSSLVALSLALLVWLYMRSRDQEMLDNVVVPVQITLAAGQSEYYELDVTGPSQAIASFSGPPSRIRELRALLQRGELRVDVVFAVPADRQDDARYLDTVRVEASDIHPPAGVTTVLVEGRNRIPVTLNRLVERRLPVRLERASDVPIAQIQLEPAYAQVRGPQEILDRVREIPTQPCACPARSESLLSQEVVSVPAVPLVQQLEGRRIQAVPAAVSARLTLQPRQKVYEVTDVPVQFLCPANFPLRPLFSDERAGKISLRLLGPAGEEAPSVIVFVDLTGRKWEPGLYEEPLRLQLPKDFQLAQNPPRQAAFQLVAPDSPLKPAGGVRGP
jgi:hypothetical protein